MAKSRVKTKKTIKKTTKKLTNKSRVTKSKKASKKMNIFKKDKKNTNIIKWIIGIVIAIVVVIIIVALVAKNGTSRKMGVTNVSTIEELNEKTRSSLQKPDDASNVTYGVENGDIARMDYSKKVSTDKGVKTMGFTLRSSYDEKEIEEDLPKEWGDSIEMTVKCKDDSDVEVKSNVSTDGKYIMKATWFDNDKYYVMFTENLESREEFLQEVNRVIIKNHVAF